MPVLFIILYWRERSWYTIELDHAYTSDNDHAAAAADDDSDDEQPDYPHDIHDDDDNAHGHIDGPANTNLADSRRANAKSYVTHDPVHTDNRHDDVEQHWCYWPTSLCL